MNEGMPQIVFWSSCPHRGLGGLSKVATHFRGLAGQGVALLSCSSPLLSPLLTISLSSAARSSRWFRTVGARGREPGICIGGSERGPLQLWLFNFHNDSLNFRKASWLRSGWSFCTRKRSPDQWGALIVNVALKYTGAMTVNDVGTKVCPRVSFCLVRLVYKVRTYRQSVSWQTKRTTRFGSVSCLCFVSDTIQYQGGPAGFSL